MRAINKCIDQNLEFQQGQQDMFKLKRSESNESSFYFPNMLIEESKHKITEQRDHQIISEIDSQFEGSNYGKSESTHKKNRYKPSNYVRKESSEFQNSGSKISSSR